MPGKYYVYRIYIEQPGFGRLTTAYASLFQPIYNPCNLPDGTFYVGKGTANRMYQHEKDCRARLKRGNKQKLTHKDKTFIQAWDRGAKIGYEVLYRTDDETDAFNVESKFITQYGLEYLTNVAYPRRIVPGRRFGR